MRITRVASIVLTLVAAACGGDSSGGPTQPGGGGNTNPPPAANRAPSITAMSITAFGIQSLSQFAYTASATDPDGDAVTYTWDIAGNPASGSSGAFTFSNGGSFTARVTVSDGKGGTATDTRNFVVGSMTGTWTITSGLLTGGTFTLTQSATGLVTGNFFLPGIGNGNTDPAQPGRIDVNGNLTMRVKVAPFTDFNMNGVMTQTGATVSGSLQGSGFSGDPFTMRK